MIKRIFKLGSLEHKILPTPEACRRLAEIIKESHGEEDFQVIWGPDIEVIDLDTSKQVEEYIVGQNEVDEDGIVTIKLYPIDKIEKGFKKVETNNVRGLTK